MKSQVRLGWWVVLTIAALTAIRVFVAAGSELFPQEAYYWTYSLHPAWGYYDHPPFVAWVAAAGTALLGHTELGVRLGSIVLWVGTCAALWGTTRLWFGRTEAHWAALLFALLPISAGIGLVLLPDAPLLFCWAAMLLTVSLAVKQSGWWWLPAGVTFGGALLAKYPAAALAPSLILFLMLAPAHRQWLWRAGPWVALVMGLAMFSPVVMWNVEHDWASFQFQISRADGRVDSRWAQAGLFWVLQLAVLSPLVLLLFGVVAKRAWKRGVLCGESAWAFVGAFGLPLFLLFAIVSPNTDSRANWTAPAFLALSMGGAAWLTEKLAAPGALTQRRWRRLVAVGVGFCVLVLLTGYSVIRFGQPWFLGTNQIGGWRALAAEVEQWRREARTRGEVREPFVLGMDRYHLAAIIGFYTQRPDLTVNWYPVGAPGLSYPYWSKSADWRGRNVVAVLRGGSTRQLRVLQRHCAEIGAPQTVQLETASWRKRHYWLVLGRDFQDSCPHVTKLAEARP